MAAGRSASTQTTPACSTIASARDRARGAELARYFEGHRADYRIVDIYGTDAAANSAASPAAGDYSLLFCCLQLPSLRQYLSWIPPAVPDPLNTLLGFVLHVDAEVVRSTPKLPKRAYVWGKETSYWHAPGVAAYLQIFQDRGYELHATSQAVRLPGLQVTNHFSLGHRRYLELLASSALYIGLGDPVIGPSSLEAMACGCVYINPKFDPPRTLNGKKPNGYRYTSQVPLAESIGAPHAYTVGIRDLPAVNAVLDKIAAPRARRPLRPSCLHRRGLSPAPLRRPKVVFIK